jgi:hypothetical protein
MRQNCNPNPHKGDRNVFCNEYNFCLDTAISKFWNSWNCCKCPSRFTQASGRQYLSISTDDIAEYELSVQPIDLDWGGPDFGFDLEFDVMAPY